MPFRSLFLTPLLLAVGLATPAVAMQSQSSPVEQKPLVRLIGNTHRFASPVNDRGPLDPSTPLPGMKLLLKRTPAQETALDAELAAQLDPKSPEFHKWMHAKEFGQRYGISDAGLARVTQWLEGHGFHIDEVATGRNTLTFSGTAGQVNEAFHLTMHQYMVAGNLHTANDGDPQIPAELAPYIAGFASLNDFYPQPRQRHTFVLRDMKAGKYHKITQAQAQAIANGGPKPDFTVVDSFGDTDEWLSPYDAATIYNYKTLWSSGNNGAGQTIAITGSSDVSQSDFSTFRSTFGLPAQTLTVIQTGADPGYTGARGENSMDVELSGGAAPGAKIVLVVSGGTSTTPGFLTSAEYIVDKEVASIMSTSYGGCELDWGTSGNQFWAANWKQADAEGITSFVSSGDSGSDSCDTQDKDPNAATSGFGVSALASTPYATAVGGTDLFWQNSPSTYFSSTNDSNGASALSYVPEVPWNSTCTSPYVYSYEGASDAETFCNEVYQAGQPYEDYWLYLDSGNGGVSDCTAPTGTDPSTCAGGYGKPAWQTGTGVPSDGKRDVPDVSLMASGGIADVPNTAWLVCDSEQAPCNYTNTGDVIYQASGGTSASSPAMAGIMALVQQKYGSQGLINPTLYAMFNKETLSNCEAFTVNATSNSCVFYDIIYNTNSQVCVAGSPDCTVNTSGDAFGTLAGWNSQTGYDLTTGLGSVNVANLVANWIPTSGSAVNTTTTLTVTPNPGTVNGNVTISVAVKKSSGSGTPTGSVNILINGTNITALTLTNGSASTGLSFNTAGTYQIQAQYQGDSSDNTSNSAVVNEVISSGTTKVGTTTTVAGTSSVVQGGTATLTATVKKSSGSGVPTGTVTFTAGGQTLYTGTLNSSGQAVLSGPANYPPGTYTVTATYNGDSNDITSQGTFNVTVKSATKYATTTTATASPNPVAQNAAVTITAHVTSSSGTPTGTVTFSYGSTKLGSATLSNGYGTIGANASVPQGSYAVTVSYSGDTTHAASTGTVTVKVN